MTTLAKTPFCVFKMVLVISAILPCDIFFALRKSLTYLTYFKDKHSNPILRRLERNCFPSVFTVYVLNDLDLSNLRENIRMAMKSQAAQWITCYRNQLIYRSCHLKYKTNVRKHEGSNSVIFVISYTTSLIN